MMQIINGKKHFTLPQPKYELPGCNVKLLKDREVAGKMYPAGWCLFMDPETIIRWSEEGTGEPFNFKETATVKSQILDSKGENVEKVVEKESKPKHK